MTWLPNFKNEVPEAGGGGGNGLIFAEHVPLASQGPYPIAVYSVGLIRPQRSHFWANM